jgi:uncharacterized glyoxalase superfamily protein PhnB
MINAIPKGVRNYNTSSNREKCQEAIEYYKLAFDAEEQYHYIFQRSKMGINSKIELSTK